jgi:hypothetical protein
VTTFIDDFNRADSTNLGPDWVKVSGNWAITSGQLSPGSDGGTVIARSSISMDSSDNYAQAKITATVAASQGVWCRGSSDLSSGYLLRNNGDDWTLFSILGGSFFDIAVYTAPAVVGDVVKVQAVGNTIKGFINGVERISVTDTTVATGTYVGIRCESTNSLRWDDFASGDVVGGESIGIAVESETAQSLVGQKSSAIGVTSESETAQPLSGNKIFTVGPSIESSTGQDLQGQKFAVFGTAYAVETALALIGTKSASIVPAVEQETAQALNSSPGTEVPPVAQSILNSVKKVVGLSEFDYSFDLDILMHINSTFATLTQLGVGPDEGFEVEDESAQWVSFLGTDKQYNFVKSYVYLKVRMLFDPPSTSFLLDAYHKQIDELTFRISVLREGEKWIDPSLSL